MERVDCYIPVKVVARTYFRLPSVFALRAKSCQVIESWRMILLVDMRSLAIVI